MAYDSKIAYGVNSQKATQLILAGLSASAVMTVVGYLLREIGISAPDFAAEYGAVLNGQIYPGPFSGLWWTGLLWHAVNGTVLFSFLYDYLAHQMVLPNQRRFKGLLYGAGIWLLVSAVVAPLAGEGFFFSNLENSFVIAFTTLVCWLVYGLVLDQMTRVRMVHQLGISEKRAA